MAKECPSGAYAAELVTASGLTIAHPLEDPGSTLGVPHSLIDWSGSEIDYAEWHALGTALLGRLEKSWLRVKSWPGTARMPVAEYNGYIEGTAGLDGIRERWSMLRLPWRGKGSSQDPAWAWGYGGPDAAVDATDEIAALTQLLTDSQCLREKLDDALQRMGGEPERPGAAHTPKDEDLGLLGTAGLVGGAILLVGGSIYLATRIAKGRNSA